MEGDIKMGTLRFRGTADKEMQAKLTGYYKEMETVYWETYGEWLPDVYLELNPRLRTRGGWARAMTHEVCLNYRLMKENPDQLRQVFVHEVCHITVGLRYPWARGHGHEWKREMKYHGCSPDRCHDMKTEHLAQRRKRHKVYCGCPDDHEVTSVIMNRMKKGRNYRCKACKTRLSLEKKED